MDNASAKPVGNPANRSRRRAIPIIDARFQWKYTLIITALGVGITAIMGAFLYRAHADNTRLLELEGNLLLQQQVMRGDQIFLLYIVVLVIVMTVALAFWGLVVTHRVSGPLHVIARYLNQLADGRYPDLRPLRKHDELQDFFATFEDAVNRLKNKDIVNLQSIDEAIAAVKKASEKNATESLAIAIKELEKQRSALSRCIYGD
ncbi:MAG: hypothetical protein JW841_16205 [Deltaproteobacteria bacterium]|nr:hypothetical protein [Deltaproteobacteria bacterium]